MNAWYRCLAAGFTLAFALALGACSKDDTDAGAEPEQQTAPESVEDEASGGEASTGQADWQQEESFLSTELGTAYQQRCIDADGDEVECEILRSLVVVETVMALEEIERSRDQRGVEEAMEALDIEDEPEIQIAAMRILGKFPDTPGVSEKVLPLLLDSPWLAVQEMAARVLNAADDPQFRTVGSLWRTNHEGVGVQNEYEEYPDLPPHYADMGFPEYPNAEWFSPLDSDRSIGWSVADDAAAVAQWFGEALNAEVIDAQTFIARLSERQVAAFQTIDEGKLARVQQLMEEWTKTQDLALLEEIQKLQEEIYAPAQAMAEAADLGPEKIALPPGAEYYDSARYIVAEERDGQTARVVLVYRLPERELTLIQHGWNLGYYPSAWPQEPGEEPAAAE